MASERLSNPWNSRKFLARVKPVSVSDQVFDHWKPYAVHILTHRGEWISARMVCYGLPGDLPCGSISLVTDQPIEGGTSGGPVVDRRGRLVGVVSWSNENERGELKVAGMPVVNLGVFQGGCGIRSVPNKPRNELPK